MNKQLTPNAQQQINRMLKQNVIDTKFIQQKGFIQNFFEIVQTNITKLSKNIFGDYTYQRKNNFSVKNKLKILNYLQEKYLLIAHNLNENTKKNYYNYDPNFFEKKPETLAKMKEIILMGKSQVQAAQDNLQRLKKSKDYIRGQFLNQAAYQFDRQRYCSIFWGIITASIINSTIYKKGRTPRKAALLVTVAHIFGQVSYHMNLDRYFDSVYKIFQQQAEKYVKQEKKNENNRQKVFIANDIQA